VLTAVGMKDDLTTIDPAQLAAVTGGTTSTDQSQQLQMMLQQLMSSIQSLAQNQGGGNNQLMQLLPIFMMMRDRNAPAPAPVVYPETVVGPDGLTYTKAG
jgi:hypothetical protein